MLQKITTPFGLTRICLLTFLWIATGCGARSSSSDASEVFAPGNSAINGYDPVAFFTESKPVKGKDEYTITWKDARWSFASRENLELFKADPEKYAPQYGGYCAFGTADGHKAPTEPGTWTILNGKLYFNYNDEVKKQWDKNRDSLITKADANWPTVKTQK